MTVARDRRTVRSMLADGTRQQLDPRYIRLERVVGNIVTAVLSLAGLVALVVVATFASLAAVWIAALGLAWLVASVVLAWAAYRWPALAFDHASYRVDAEVLEVRGGVVWRSLKTVPRSRVQHTDVAQSPLERRYGLATLVVHTAGTAHAQVTLDGLAHETALGIRDHLLPREHADAV